MPDELEPEIREVMAEEKSRGRRPIDVASRRERRTLLADLGRFVRTRDERAFIETIRARGIQEGSPRFRELLELFWDQVRPPSRKPREKP